MSLIKKSDAKNDLSPHRHAGIHLHVPASQPDATGFSGEESGKSDSQAKYQVQEPSEQPVSSELKTSSTASDLNLKPVLVPKLAKSAQA